MTMTNMPARLIGKTLETKNSLKKTLEKSKQRKYLTMTYLQRVFPVSLFPLRENARVFRTRQKELFSLKYAELLELKDQNIYYLKMLRDSFRMMREGRLRSFSCRWMNLGMMSNGRCLTLNIGCPKIVKGSLSSVLEEKVNKKYYLSKKMLNKLSEQYEQSSRISDDISYCINTPTGGHHIPKIATCIDANYYKGWLAHGQRQMISNKTKIRRLTPKECERLQGFPDDWTRGVSDTQRYKQMGNAVSVPVIKAIGRKLYDLIRRGINGR